jgi:SAM-dependent methyltransferase
MRFNEHLVECVLALLPEGGTSIEAGCGGGAQSLALAKTGLFKTTLLDISEQALRHAQLRFQQAQVAANFIVGSALDHAAAEFDLVFNNGTLEHYSFDEQVAFVEAMSSRSRRYVISLVPNANCYWYWMWRVMSSAAGDWPYGTEVPVYGQADVFQAAGLRNGPRT